MASLVLIFFNAFFLCGLLYFFARDVADFEFQKVAVVSAVISAGARLLQLALAPYLDVFVLLPIGAFTMVLLMKYCWVTFRQAALVLLFFGAGHLLISLAIGHLKGEI